MRIVCLGEGMIELSGQPLQRRYGGDTLNTAIYLARLCRPRQQIGYLSALGADSLSAQLLRDWQAEGLDTRDISILPDALPGLYMVETDAMGERSFLYWRRDSAASRYFASGVDFAVLLDVRRTQALYLSGITLALFHGAERRRLMTALAVFKQQGGQLWFDNNFRPALWSAEDARSCHEAVLALADIALLTADDEARLYGGNDADDIIQRAQALGCPEVVVKRGAGPCLAALRQQRWTIAARPVAEVVDTCAAGDAFGAGYLASRLSGLAPEQAAHNAHALAAAVIGYPGAIMPDSAMPPLPYALAPDKTR